MSTGISHTIDFLLSPSFPKDPVSKWVVVAPLCVIAGGTICRILLNRHNLIDTSKLDHDEVLRLTEECAKEYAAYYLGRTMIIPKDDARVKRIDRILGLLLASNQELINCFNSDIGKWRFNVLLDNEVVTTSFPCGYVFVHQGMINTATTDDELAFALSHEMAKVYLRTTERELNRRVLPWKILVFALRPVTWQLCTKHINNLFAKLMVSWNERSLIKIQNSLCFDKDKICECDAEAFKFMTKAGFDPRSVASLLMKFYLQERMNLFWVKRGVPGEIQRGLLNDPWLKLLSLPIPMWRKSTYSSKNRWDMVAWRLTEMEELRRQNGIPVPALDPRKEPHQMAKKMDDFISGNGNFFKESRTSMNMVASPVTAQVLKNLLKDDFDMRSNTTRSFTGTRSNVSMWSDSTVVTGSKKPNKSPKTKRAR